MIITYKIDNINKGHFRRVKHMIKKFLLLMPIIILSLFFVNIAPAFAADDIDMNLTSNETSNTMATASTYQPTTSSTYSTTSSSGLDISNILNILLIVIGILLILLSIAILIRLKH
jgi:multisubunit Na+/H+ antiporter MnhB subunit